MIQSIHASTAHSVRLICETLGLPRSSYHHAARPCARQLSDAELSPRIEAVFRQHQRRYGYRRIYHLLRQEGVILSPDRVRRLMREAGLIALQPKTYVPQTSDGRADKPSDNLLQGRPLPIKPNEVWAGDITYIPSEQGWLYLAVIIDLCSRRIVGWSLRDHLRRDLVVEALDSALAARRGTQGIIFHSDRGSQYGSSAFRQRLRAAGMEQSMSARANPYHNAWTESFIGTLKAEMLRDGCFTSQQDAAHELFAFIDGYYNTRRLHSSLNYKSPSLFESEIALAN